MKHSLSPRIHTIFAQQTQQNISYQPVLVDKGNFAEVVTSLREQGWKGMNVTLPFKAEAWQIAARKSRSAERALAVNTLIFDSGDEIAGENTDGIGLIRDLRDNHAVLIKNKHVLVLGAGGGVRGVLHHLVDEQPNTIVIANRTVSNAQNLVDAFAATSSISACGFADLSGGCYDIIINGTAASLQGDMPPLPENILAPHGCCYDMMYAINGETIFTTWGHAHGARLSIDGLGMLIEQAAESFFIWRNIRPDTSKLAEQLRDQTV